MYKTSVIILLVSVGVIAGQYFHCESDGKQIWVSQTCDCVANCNDKSDEAPELCPNLDTDCFLCPGSDGVYLAPYQVCDNTWDCLNGEEEENCPTESAENDVLP
ncbi:hypothetical protein CAPTEDRAFT_206594 [Capitella teleta]|uniref:TIL domain-containing protein n=1 Tax=Capitella teleta TaxID=283909 RepID=R7UBI1_CAPTE|nr:hypothetical protein CAPTEDRAFT_206594 [Capitella teleta]|eukprot:ELU00627.1 hypothetical protein CAPTEDRAFT_206594 [Capitella teleta]